MAAGSTFIKETEKINTVQAETRIYLCIFCTLERINAQINNAEFLNCTAELFGSKQSLKSAFFKISKVLGLGGLVEDHFINIHSKLCNPTTFQ